MKVIIASDLHGSFYYVNQLIERFIQENCDHLILLGDILYHGPRNDLPKDYSPKKVISLLNSIKEKVICVRGNCDAEVDGMVLEFDILTPYKRVEIDGKILHLTHGHKFNEKSPLPQAKEGEIVLFGHSHLPFDKTIDKARYINPGSVSIPKEKSKHSYLFFENGSFTFHFLKD